MIYFCMKSWLSNCMKFVIVQGSLSYRLLVCGEIYLCSLYQCFHQPCGHNPWRGYIKVGLVLLIVSYLLCLRATEGMPNNSSHLFYCITTLVGRHRIVGFDWIVHWWLLGACNTTRSCWQGHDLFIRSSIIMICLMLICSMIFTSGFSEDGGWLTLDAKWCAYDMKVECWITL